MYGVGLVNANVMERGKDVDMVFLGLPWPFLALLGPCKTLYLIRLGSVISQDLIGCLGHYRTKVPSTCFPGKYIIVGTSVM